MNTIVDGYNLIFAMGWMDRKDSTSLALEKARRRLVHQLSQRINQADRVRCTIVFDAKQKPIKEVSDSETVAGFPILFAHSHDEADALIEEMIAKHSTPKSLTIVSDDLRLQTAAQRKKAIAVGCEAWLDQLETTKIPADSGETEPGKDSAIKDLEQTDWLAEFGLDQQTQSDNPNQSASGSDGGSDRPTYNPFPPGYGEDLLD